MRKLTPIFLALLLSISFVGCGEGGGDPSSDAGIMPAEGNALALSFSVSFGDEPADCVSRYEGFGPAGDQRVGLEELRFFIHGVELINAGGERVPATIVDEAPWQSAGVAYLHFANPADGCLSDDTRRDEIRIVVPEDDYEGLVFRLGVPEELNHLDPSLAASPLNIVQMHWGWMMGYLYFRAELSVETDSEGGEGSMEHFAIHIGSMACEGSLVPEPDIHCAYPNRGLIELPSFRPGRDTILLDLAALIGRTDLRPESEEHHGSAGCMSELDPEGEGYAECIEPMTSLGIEYGAHPATMDAFRVGN